jgi:fatty acyl-CoA reductase
LTKNRLVGPYPNTYTYTKQLAEQILEKECGAVPLAIVRPSIVTAALREPFPGWIDNLNGPTGLIAGGGKGFIRIFKVESSDFVTDLIPVDLSINLMIAVAWRTAIYKCVNTFTPY